ncbi:hypothetical protein OEZ86_005570 [Tetradesmus obliquus]|nr:hypothetical protein OEZ86_005570 [Tetradesmus obliquus]
MPHHAVLSHRAEELIELRLDDLEHNHLAHPAKPISPAKALLRNLWVLLLCGGVLTVVLLGKSRLHVAEPLEHVHAVNSAEPYFVPLGTAPIKYLYIANIAAPWHGAAGDSSGGHRRRRRGLLGAAAHAVSQQTAALLEPLFAAGVGGTAAAAAAAGRTLKDPAALQALHLKQLMKQQLSHPRRVLAAAAPPGGPEPSAPPQLTMQIMQRNTTKAATAAAAAAPSIEALPNSVLSPAAYGFHSVSQAVTCNLKEGQAVKCNAAITTSSLSDAFEAGQENFLVLSLNTPGQVAVELHFSEIGKLGYAKNWLALAILLGMLVAIATEKVHRMWCAFVAAFAMMSLLLWCNMTPSLAKVTEFLDESTLGLLFGMMILVGKLKDTGLFEVLCAATLKASRGKMWLLSVLMMYITACVSAFLDNVTTMLLMGPITISMMKTANGRDPRPMLMAQVLMSNIGGTATMVGDPPNIIIGTALQRYLGFVDFILHLAPGVIAASVPAAALILWLYRKELLGPIPDYSKVLSTVGQYRVTDWDLMAKSGYVMVVVLLGFLLHPLHHLDPAWFAIIGASILCIITSRLDVEEIMHSVEWDMLLFFAAQFVMVECAAEIGMIDMIGGWLEAIIRAAPAQQRTLVAVQILLWASAFISGILDNIPYTITMVPVIDFLASSGLGLNIQTLAWALAFGACFGGNATLIGASANIVTATILERQGFPMSFLGWMRVGIPVTIATVAVANLYMFRYCF